MRRIRLKKIRRKALSCLLALSMVTPTIVNLPLNIMDVYAETCSQPHEWTGLKFYWTDIPASQSSFGSIMGWPRKSYVTGGNGEYKNYANHYLFCIANHENGQVTMGAESFIKKNLTIQDWSAYSGFSNLIADTESKKFAFCLVAAAVMWSYQRTNASDVSSPTANIAVYALPYSMLCTIESRMDPTGISNGWGFRDKNDKEGSYSAFMKNLDAEFGLTTPNGVNAKITDELAQQILSGSRAFFDDVWSAAEVMYNCIQDGTTTNVANTIVSAADPSDPNTVISTINCEQNTWDTYFSNIALTSDSAKNYTLTGKSYDVASKTGTLTFKLTGSSDSPLQFKFNNQGYITDLSQPVLTEFAFCTNGEDHDTYQTMFGACYKEPTITVKSGGGEKVPLEGLTEGSIELEVHRYKHDEEWTTNYNVDLLKLDAETGKPLSGSEWDILEYDTLGSWDDGSTQLGSTYLDHPVSEASNIGTKYNWANDDGTQFTRWEEDEEDPCKRDRNITGTDGYLYNEDNNGSITTSKAHSDSYQYKYTKGYCTGHPKPKITYYEGDSNEVAEKNAELDELAEEAWQEQVDYCEKLAAEGGFFHTTEESITDTAKNEMEADRDEFFKDYISLTYDYSAKEITARNGYILHDLHTDDIPVERVVIHSSEFLNLISNASGASSGLSNADDNEVDNDTDNDNDTEEFNLSSVVSSVSDEEMSDEETAARIETSDDKAVVDSDDDISVEAFSLDDDTTYAGSIAVVSDDIDEKNEEVKNEEVNSVRNKSNNSTASPSNAKKAADDEEYDPDYLPDIELADDDDLVDGELATPSELNELTDEVTVEKKTLWNILVEGWYAVTRRVSELFQNAVAAISDDGTDDDGNDDSSGGGYARNDTEPPKTDGVIYIGAINFEKSEVTDHEPGVRNIECWTFIAYDHRTEGEIHFNKKDLNLKAAESEDYDAYAGENADGTLEGAVYGLFAANDIIHPDSDNKTESDLDTGVVYKKGDLVAIATTDRNGDASFMTFTEAPGKTYDYETGKVVDRDNWMGPTNLHREQVTADEAVQDNEKFYGWNTEGSEEVTLTDSDAGDATYYRKHSSNQGLNLGKGQDDGTTYPIDNNEDNNGNCWIGRPLIVSSENSAQYYIKELSRSEGYELSVYGSDLTLSNREAFLKGEDVELAEGEVKKTAGVSGTIDDDGAYTNEFTITATDTANGFTLTARDMGVSGDNAIFYTSERKPVTKTVTEEVYVEKEVPVEAEEGTPVLINGSRVEAVMDDVITLPNGESATVNNTISEKQTKFYQTKNSVPYSLPTADSVNAASGDSFADKYNDALATANFGVPASNAPWVLVSAGSSDQEAFNNLTTVLSEYTGFHQIRIVDKVDGNLVVQYDLDGENAIYDIGNQFVWIKHSMGVGSGTGYIYAKYDATTLTHNTTGFMVNVQTPNKTSVAKYDNLSDITFKDAPDKTYWAYAAGEQARKDDGSLQTMITLTKEERHNSYTVWETTNTAIDSSRISYDAAKNMYSITFDVPGTYIITVKYRNDITDGTVNAYYAMQHADIGYYIPLQHAGSYIQNAVLSYPGQNTIYESASTDTTPVSVTERPIRQQVKVSKDTETLPETLKVWYCANDGVMNSDDVDTCEGCGRKRTVEETKEIHYAHDTYTAFFNEDLSEKKQETNWITRLKTWLATITGVSGSEDSAKAVANFRFKAYLKSNLERLYRDEDGKVVWVDRNGNEMTPIYKDTNGDGLYDTFTWETYNAVESDFPEKDKTEDGKILSTNVQKIFTKVEHPTTPYTTSAIANNVWDTYLTPENGASENVAERNNSATTNQRNKVDRSDDAVKTNLSLYSYQNDATNVLKSDWLRDNQNTGYTRILESTETVIEDGTSTRTEQTYNYEKFFDAIAAANTDKWDDNIDTCTFNYDGYDTPVGKISMQNYPGQNWENTLKEENQKGDTDNSFDLFRWIHQKIYGSTEDYQKFQDGSGNYGNLTGTNVETTTSTSDYARANAEASNAVRQFAVKWYLEDEVAKLVKNNGVGDGEDIAKTEAEGGAPGITEEGVVPYDDYVHDYALFKALQKAYNYLRPFYENDLDTIYSVEWDSDKDGGNDKDVTTLSVDTHEDGAFYNTSSYIPYGVYVVVEQTPSNFSADTGYDLVNRAFNIEKPKEVIVPSVYEGTTSNDTTDNYDAHYNFDSTLSPETMAASKYDGGSGYLIRFNEEWPTDVNDFDDNQSAQGTSEHVIRAHGYYGDFEVFKYGLDVDKNGKEASRSISDNGGYAFRGFTLAQSIFDPLKDYYSVGHNGESKDGTMSQITASEGGEGDNSVRFPLADLDRNNEQTANGTNKYDIDTLINRFFYASVSEDNGRANDVIYKGGASDDNNVSGMQFKDNVKTVTGELTAYEGKYAQMLVPWTVTAPADITNYSSSEFSGYADVNERDSFKASTLTIRKVDAETGEQIIHDDTVFGIYAASRYTTEDEILADAEKLSGDEKTKFINQFKPGDTKFYMEDTKVYGSKEFLEAMGAYDISYLITLDQNKAKRYGENGYKRVTEGDVKNILGANGYTKISGTIEYGVYHLDVLSGTSIPDDENVTWYYSVYNTDSPLCAGTIPKGTPICSEKNAVILQDNFTVSGDDNDETRTGMLKAYSTLNDVLMEDEDKAGTTSYHLQNTGYIRTPQPLGSGCYVVAELKTPSGYLRGKPEAHEIYSGVDYYYEGGDMFKKAAMVDYAKRIDQSYSYAK